MNKINDLDESVLERLMKIGGQEFLDELFDLYLEHTPQKLRDAVAGSEAGDASAVERAVHSLKSSSGNIGARAVQDLCNQIEEAASAGNQEKFRTLVPELQAAYDRLLPRIRDIRGRTDS
ncbi:Hpt domain-containing protein [Candidatus Neomarinimicrobiota bacterium]